MFNLGIATGWSAGDSRPLRAATVVRVSTADQAQEGRSGLDRQRNEVQKIALSKGYEIVLSLELVDVSGTQIFSTLEGMNLLRAVEAREVDIVVVTEMSRLFRPDDLASFALLDVFKRNSVPIDTGSAVNDLSSAEGFLSGGILGLLAGFERMSLLRKINQSKNSARARGKCPSSDITLPLGVAYDRKLGRFYYTEDVARVVEAFRLFDEEAMRSYTTVGQLVGIQGATLKGLLKNKIFCGLREYVFKRDQARKYPNKDGRQADRPKIPRLPHEQIVVRVIEADKQAVSDERFARVGQAMAEISRTHRAIRERGQGNLGTGILRCGYCGQKIYSCTSSKRSAKDGSRAVGSYICKSRHYLSRRKGGPVCEQPWLPKASIDQLLERFVRSFLQDESFLKSVQSQALRKREPSCVNREAQSDIRQRRLEDLRRRESRIVDAYESGAIDLETLNARRLRIDVEREAVVRHAPSGQETSSTPDALALGLDQRTWDELKAIDDKKKFIGRLFTTISIRGRAIGDFRLAAGLIDPADLAWGWAVGKVVTLPQPFGVDPLHVPLPEGLRRCTKCAEFKPDGDFYSDGRAACIACTRALQKESYQKRKRNG